MISKASRFITLVVYDRERNTKAFNLDKHALKIISIAIPLIFIFCLATFGLLSAKFRSIIGEIRQQAPEELVRLKASNTQLTAQLTEAQNTAKEFEGKLQAQNVPSVDGHPYSRIGGPIAPMSGAADLTAQKLIDVDGTQSVIDSNKVVLKFNILNSETQDKVQGHIIVLMRDGNSLQIYPEANALNSPYLTNYSRGETFTVSRFRPVEASFNRPPLKSKSLYFKIALFNRTGDILVLKDFGPIENR